jgi:phage-related protein
MVGPAKPLRPLLWVSSSRDDLREFPDAVQDAFGFALYLVQIGERPARAKSLKGLGSGIVELVSDFGGDAFRAVYTARFEKAIYVLHAFKKKAKQGVKTPKAEIDLVRRRLRAAEDDYRRRFGEEGKR